MPHLHSPAPRLSPRLRGRFPTPFLPQQPRTSEFMYMLNGTDIALHRSGRLLKIARIPVARVTLSLLLHNIVCARLSSMEMWVRQKPTTWPSIQTLVLLWDPSARPAKGRLRVSRRPMWWGRPRSGCRRQASTYPHAGRRWLE